MEEKHGTLQALLKRTCYFYTHLGPFRLPGQLHLHEEQPPPQNRDKEIQTGAERGVCSPEGGSLAFLGDPPIPGGGVFSLSVAGPVISPSSLGPNILKLLW